MTDSKISIDSEAIRTLAGLLDETGLTEIEVADGDRKLRVSRGGQMVAATAIAPMAGGHHHGPATAEGPGEGSDASHPGAVKSPMVGTVYSSPEPGAPPFVKAGDQVGEGDTLVIIEAMKVMNPIRAPRSGRIARVLVENGSPVEYGQVLMVID